MFPFGHRAKTARWAAPVTALILLAVLLTGCASGPPGAIPPSLPQPAPMPLPAPVPGGPSMPGRFPLPGPSANVPFLMNGEVKDIGSQGILVEGPTGGDACWITLPSAMPLVIERPDGAAHDMDAADLAIGLHVSVWHDGPVRESYPCQATGAYVKVHADPGDLTVPALVDVQSVERLRSDFAPARLLQPAVPEDRAEVARLLTWLWLAEAAPELTPPTPTADQRGPGLWQWVLHLPDDQQAIVDYLWDCTHAGGDRLCAVQPDYAVYTDPDGEQHVLHAPQLFRWLERMAPEG